MSEKSEWEIAQKNESEWWGECLNTYFEEEKQLKYAGKMGLHRKASSKTPYVFDMGGKSVLDIGGGPTSILLKCVNVRGVIIDPLKFPSWVEARYRDAGIEYRQGKGEDIDVSGFDEVWIYNVLQHADCPEKIIQNARNAGNLIRIFEWVDTPPNPTHPNKLIAQELDQWLGGKGVVEPTEGGRLPAKMYYGQFVGNVQEKVIDKIIDNEEMKVYFVTTGPEFSYTYYLGIMTAIKVYGDKVRLLYTEEPVSKYFDLLRHKVKMEKVDAPVFPALAKKDSHFQRVAIFDYIVWNAVYNHGGIIMGLDSLTLKSHFDLLHPDKEMLAPIDAPGTLYTGMHGVIVRKGSPLAKSIIDKATASLNSADKEIKWGDSGMTPYVHSIPDNLDKISLAPFQMVCGRNPNLFKEDGQMPHADTRTIPLYASSSKHDMKMDDAFIEKSQSPYAKLVKKVLSESEWHPIFGDVLYDDGIYSKNGPQGAEGPKGLYSPIDGSPIKNIRHKRFHLLGLPHVATNKNEALACAFSQKVIKMAQMLKSLGHTVFFYGVEGSEVECDEFIQVSTQDVLKQAYGDYDMTKVTYKHAQGDIAYSEFNENAIDGIKNRMWPNDFLLIPFCPPRYKMILDALDTPSIDSKDRLYLTVEMGIGYRGTSCRFKVFESVSQMHFNYGLDIATEYKNKLAKLVQGERKKPGTKEFTLGELDRLLRSFDMGAKANGNWYDTVIPNYFDPNDFEYSKEKKDYYLYLGRIAYRKGIAVAIKTLESIGGKLILAGQIGDPGIEKLFNSPNVEYVGFADVQKRKELLRDARALFLPTYYIEPFGGVIIEAAFSGTPVITSDWGAFPELVIHGKTGYRCHTLDHFVWATENIGNIKPIDCYTYAMENFSLDRVRWMYEEYFNMLLDVKENVNGQGWNRLHPERTQLDWLIKNTEGAT